MATYCDSCGVELGERPGRFCRACGSPIDTPADASPGSVENAAAAAGKSPNRWPLLAAGLVVVAALGAAVVLLLSQNDSTDSSSTSAPPSPREVPPNVVQVTHVPASLGVVTKGDFDHAMEQAAAQSSLKAVPLVGEKKYDELKETALKGILEAIWLEGQAIEMGVAVTPVEISTQLAKLRRENFKTEGEYRNFLQTSHFTSEDVDERVKLQLLSTRLQNKLSETKGGSQLSEAAKQKAFTKFVAAYQRRWKSRTVCAPAFVIEECSNK